MSPVAALLFPALLVSRLPQPLVTPTMVRMHLLWLCNVLGDNGNSPHLPSARFCGEPDPQCGAAQSVCWWPPQVPRSSVPPAGQGTVDATGEQCLEPCCGVLRTRLGWDKLLPVPTESRGSSQMSCPLHFTPSHGATAIRCACAANSWSLGHSPTARAAQRVWCWGYMRPHHPLVSPPTSAPHQLHSSHVPSLPALPARPQILLPAYRNPHVVGPCQKEAK